MKKIQGLSAIAAGLIAATMTYIALAGEPVGKALGEAIPR